MIGSCIQPYMPTLNKKTSRIYLFNSYFLDSNLLEWIVTREKCSKNLKKVFGLDIILASKQEQVKETLGVFTQ